VLTIASISRAGEFLRSKNFIFAAALACLLSTLLFFVFQKPLLFVYQDISFAYAPTAERAAQYGSWHLSASTANLYDIDRAESWYKKAAAIDPVYPSVQHQLARIAFLRNDLASAIGYIDREIEKYGEANPNSYYIRALIEGYQKEYVAAAKDYEAYFKLAPANWAGINDYSWVLLKAGLPEGALSTLQWGLTKWPDNPWLLHNKVIALYELGRYQEAATTAAAAVAAVDAVGEVDWLIAYPGNDPRSAGEGLASFKAAVKANQEKVQKTLETKQN
jgi:tetratricopeptide (TPR) repeat protein